MRKAALFYNPLSGRRHDRRQTEVNAVIQVLREAGVEVSAAATRAPAEAEDQVRQAIGEGCDTIFACGGDGTIHDVLQGVVGGQAALAVIPLGTANALAHDLRIPFSPCEAARAALQSSATSVAVGKVEYLALNGPRASRYFTVGAGVGLDAHLFYKLNLALKKRHGMAAYYAKAWQLWMTHKLSYFSAEYVDAESGESGSQNVTELLAVRISNFGGVLRQLAPGAALVRDNCRLVLCKTAKRSAYLSYVFGRLLNTNRKVEGIELASSRSVRCDYLSTAPDAERRKIYVEADGELLGTIPAQISVVPNALRLLVPRRES
jgi:diacylglycerol kinase (ATP)